MIWPFWLFGGFGRSCNSATEDDIRNLSEEQLSKKMAIEKVNSLIADMNLKMDYIDKLNEEMNPLWEKQVRLAYETWIYAALEKIFEGDKKFNKVVTKMRKTWGKACETHEKLKKEYQKLKQEKEQIALDRRKIRQRIMELMNRHKLWGMDIDIPY